MLGRDTHSIRSTFCFTLQACHPATCESVQHCWHPQKALLIHWVLMQAFICALLHETFRMHETPVGQTLQA